MPGRPNSRTAMVAVLALLPTLVVTLLAATPAAANPYYATRTWTGVVDRYGNRKSTGLTVNPGETVTVPPTGLCYFYAGRPSNRTPGEGLTSKVGSTYFTSGAR